MAQLSGLSRFLQKKQDMRLFGLIGYPLGHSFSKKYFSEKFEREHIADARYELFPLERISGLPALLQANSELRGLNVTIPHKEQVLPCLDALDDTARADQPPAPYRNPR